MKLKNSIYRDIENNKFEFESKSDFTNTTERVFEDDEKSLENLHISTPEIQTKELKTIYASNLSLTQTEDEPKINEQVDDSSNQALHPLKDLVLETSLENRKIDDLYEMTQQYRFNSEVSRQIKDIIEQLIESGVNSKHFNFLNFNFLRNSLYRNNFDELDTFDNILFEIVSFLRT